MAKLLFFITEDWYFWSHRLPIARAAREQGFAVHLATRVQDHGQRIVNEGIHLHPLALRRRSARLGQELATLRQLLTLYRRERPDIVHHVALKPILYGSLAARLAGVPGVVNALAGLGHLFIAGTPRARLGRRLVSLFFRLAFAPPGCRVLFQNDEDRQLLVAMGVVAAGKTVLIRGSGVDTRRFRPAVGPAPGIPRVILASRMLWDKGIGELVDAARILKARGVAGEILVAGRLDEENPAAIPERTLRSWHEEGIITWLGFRQDIPELLASCQVAVLPSYREGLPKGLLEAAACGLPLVATDVPGCREVVREGENGFLVPARESLPLAERLERLLTDEPLRQRQGQASRRLAEQEFAVGRVVGETLALYRRMLASQAGGQGRPTPGPGQTGGR
ncbi:MAG: glycosyltransferase family 4 protein [Thermodesulfobacteriota bacterium]